MLLPITGDGVEMNSAMNDMNFIQHHLFVRDIGEEIDLEFGPGEDDPSFVNTTLIGALPSVENHGESEQMGRFLGFLENTLQGITLQRNLSNLELGELRESQLGAPLKLIISEMRYLSSKKAFKLRDRIHYCKTRVGKQFERKGSLQMENSTNTSEDMNSDTSEVKPSLQETLDSGKPSSVFVNPGSPVKKGTPDSFEKVADEGKDPVFADRSNRVQAKIDSSPDENNCPYSKYDKDEPELNGPITSYAQFQEYWQEYNDKNDIYLSLKKFLEGYSDELKMRVVECEDAKARGDIDGYNEIPEQTREFYKTVFEIWRKIFRVLHAELSSIKQRIKDAVDEQERGKKFKAGNLTPEDTYKDPNIQAGNRADRQGSSVVGFQKGNNQALPQTGQRSSDEIPLGNPSYPLEKSDKHGDARNDKIQATEKKIPRNFREGSNGSKLSVSKDSSYQKQGEMVGMLKEDRQDTLSQLGASPKDDNRTDLDKPPGVDRQGISLQRKFSDLNLGELRESTPDETSVAKQFERKGSFKHTNTSEDMISDITKGQTPNLCEEVADGGKDSVFSDRDNRDQKKREPSSDENSCSYSKYIQYQEYVQEFKDKYDSYLSLVKILEDYSDEFKKLTVDMDGYNEIKELIEETFRECNVRFEELAPMKQRIEDFVEKYKED